MVHVYYHNNVCKFPIVELMMIGVDLDLFISDRK